MADTGAGERVDPEAGQAGSDHGIAPGVTHAARREEGRYDGVDAGSLAGMLGVPRVVVHDRIGSTLDAAHALAEAGAPAGTLVLADEQTSGRGRGGKRWASEPGAGLWLTFVERPDDADALEVLSLRLGLQAAQVLDGAAGERVRLKWPNDLHLANGKLAGILVEARWQEQRLMWVAVGMGVNVRAPGGVERAAGLRPGTSRVGVLRELVPALRTASLARGSLSDTELDAFSTRDIARGRACVSPVAGRVEGVSATGGLRVTTGSGEVTVRSGSLVLQEEA